MADDRYHHGDLRNALLDAVEEIITEKGVGDVSLRAAARKVGVSHAAPAHHFGDKIGLLTAFAARGHERFTQAMSEVLRSHAGEPLRERMLAMGTAYLQYAMTDRACYEVMFRHEFHDEDDAELQEQSDGAFRLLLELIAEGVGTQDPESPDVVRLALVTWSLVHGAASLWQMGGPQTMVPSLTLDALAQMVCTSAWLTVSADPAWTVAA